MTKQDILNLRLLNQGLTDSKFKNAQEAVSHLGAVQSQDYSGAKWALSQRLENKNDEIIENAFTEGKILRTHVMRPTWHFVSPEDIRWIQELTGPRVNKISMYYFKQFELDEEVFKKSNKILSKALQGGNFLTRNELSNYLEKSGILTKEVLRLSYIIMKAELDGIICSGPRKGKQFTYALIEERAPEAKILPHDQALKELTEKYFTSHGPALIQDFVWWSGLTVADVKKGIEMADLSSEIVENQKYYFSKETQVPKQIKKYAFLLPNYDEYTIAYKERSLYTIPGEHKSLDTRGNIIFNNAIIIDGKVAGTWKKTLKAKEVLIEYIKFYKYSQEEKNLFDDAINRYAEYLKLKPAVKEID
jgi:hypothetical protein